MKKVNVLGTEYEVNMISEDYLKDKNRIAETDFYNKTILIDEEYIKENHSSLFEEVVRHELIHAFLFESGLNNNSDWARNEEMIDFFAIQFPKITNLFNELNILP